MSLSNGVLQQSTVLETVRTDLSFTSEGAVSVIF